MIMPSLQILDYFFHASMKINILLNGLFYNTNYSKSIHLYNTLYVPNDQSYVSTNFYWDNKRYGHTAYTFSRLMSSVLIWERFISISNVFQMTDNDTFIRGLSCWFNNFATETIDHVCNSPCLSLSLFACFWCKLPLILRVGRKLKTWAGDICKRIPRYRIWARLISWLSRYVRNG